MGRKAKFIKEIKLKIINEFYKRTKSVMLIANDYGCNARQIYNWVKSYELIGESAFDDKPKNKSYSKELKLAAIKDYLGGKGSVEDIAKSYGIYNNSTLLSWIMKYNSHKEIKDYDPKGDVYMTKARKTTFEER
ncbi:MAG: Transposase, partial [Haloplasmataceae bacterium]|nr:Transposase [Haloplasmataceae bacterium]